MYVWVSKRIERTIVFLSLIFYLSQFNKGKMLLVSSVSWKVIFSYLICAFTYILISSCFIFIINSSFLLEISLSVWSLPSMIHPRNEGLRISVPPVSSSTCFFRYFLFAPWFYFVDINSVGEATKNSWQNIFTLWWLGTTIMGKWIEHFVSGRLSIPPFIYMESHVFMAWQTDYYHRKNLTNENNFAKTLLTNDLCSSLERWS